MVRVKIDQSPNICNFLRKTSETKTLTETTDSEKNIKRWRLSSDAKRDREKYESRNGTRDKYETCPFWANTRREY